MNMKRVFTPKPYKTPNRLCGAISVERNMVIAYRTQKGANRRTERLKGMSFLLIFNDLRIDTLWNLDALSGNYKDTCNSI